MPLDNSAKSAHQLLMKCSKQCQAIILDPLPSTWSPCWVLACVRKTSHVRVAMQFNRHYLGTDTNCLVFGCSGFIERRKGALKLKSGVECCITECLSIDKSNAIWSSSETPLQQPSIWHDSLLPLDITWYHFIIPSHFLTLDHLLSLYITSLYLLTLYHFLPFKVLQTDTLFQVLSSHWVTMPGLVACDRQQRLSLGRCAVWTGGQQTATALCYGTLWFLVWVSHDCHDCLSVCTASFIVNRNLQRITVSPSSMPGCAKRSSWASLSRLKG